MVDFLQALWYDILYRRVELRDFSGKDDPLSDL